MEFTYDIIVGYEFNYRGMSTDFLMAVFAIIINTASNGMDFQKFNGKYIKGLILVIAVLCGAFILLCYHSLVKAYLAEVENINIMLVYKMGLLVTIVHGILGIVMEIVSFNQKKNEGEVKQSEE